MTVKIVPNEKGNPAGQAGGRRTALLAGSARRAEAHWVRRLGAEDGSRP